MQNTEYKIEKNIPLPVGKINGVSDILRKLKIGDSVVLRRRSNPHTMAKQVGIKVATRSISETETRVWRTA